MTICHQIIINKNLIISTASGRFNNQLLVAEFAKLYQMPNWLPSRQHLLDFRRANLSQVSHKGIKAIAKLVADNAMEPILFRCALVSKAANCDLLHHYQQEKVTHLQQVQQFNNLNSANQWLQTAV